MNDHPTKQERGQARQRAPRHRLAWARARGGGAVMAMVTGSVLLAAAPLAAVAATAWSFVRGGDGDAKGDGGVGMVLDGSGGHVVVSRLVPGGPAAKAGVRAGDRIIAIEGGAVPPGTAVAAIVGKVRGAVGSKLRLEVQAGSAPPRAVEVVRASMRSLFPSRAPRPLLVDDTLALLAVGERRHYGVRFSAAAAVDGDVRYEWVAAPATGALGEGDGVESGRGLLRAHDGGATIQVGEWRLDLEPWSARGAWVVAKSSLPVAPTPVAAFRTQDPTVATFVLPRPAPKEGATHWAEGPCGVTLAPRVEGRALPNHRLTLELRDAQGATQPTRTLRTDARGDLQLRLPAGSYTVTRLLESGSGGGLDVAFAGTLPEPMAIERCQGGTANRLELTLQARPAEPGALPASARDHALVGAKLPDIAVRAWLGGAAMPSDGRALVIFAWATWCGPCKRSMPTILEVAARLQERGLRVVLASADRDEAAIRDYVDEMLADGPALAWAGTELLDTLDVRGIPTTVVVDGAGIVRAVHTGTVPSVAAWEAELAPLLAAQAAPNATAPMAGKAGSDKAKPRGKDKARGGR